MCSDDTQHTDVLTFAHLTQKHASVAFILVMKSMPNSIMCTELGLVNPKPTSLGSSERRGYPPHIHHNNLPYKKTQNKKRGLTLCSKNNPQLAT